MKGFNKDWSLFKYQLLVWTLLSEFFVCDAENLGTLPRTAIVQFLETISHNVNLDPKCSKQLNLIGSILSNGDSKRAQHFYSSFRIGQAYHLESRDRDRWMYASTECIAAAQESLLVPSKNPLLYCHGYDSTKISDSSAFGMCLPAICESDNLYLLDAWRQFATGSSSDSVINFSECTRSRMIKQWYQRTDSLIAATVGVFLLLLVAIGTVYDIRNGYTINSQFQHILLAFSAKRNIEKILRKPIPSSSVIQCIDGLRVLSLCWVVIGHALWYLRSYTENIDDLSEHFKKFSNIWITNFLLSVDTFFVLSGTLTSFHFFCRINRKDDLSALYTLRYWLKFYCHRFLRLWPTAAFSLYVLTFGIAFAHYHRFWPPNDPHSECVKYGWENFFLLNSLTDDRCIGWTWYVSADFILFLFSPIFLLLFVKSTEYGLLLSAVIAFLSSLLNAIQIIRYNFPPTQMLFVLPPIFNQDYKQQEVHMYNPPQYRVGSYLVGLFLGYLMSGYRTPIGSNLSWSIKCSGWIGSLLLGSVALFGLYPAIQGWDWPLYNIFYGSFHHVSWALCIAWIIYACHNGFGGIVNTLLCWTGFKPLAVISYSAFLVHMAPTIGYYNDVPFPIISTGTVQLIIISAIHVVLACLAALPLVFAFELPFMNIQSLLLPFKSSSRRELSVKQNNLILDSIHSNIPFLKTTTKSD